MLGKIISKAFISQIVYKDKTEFRVIIYYPDNKRKQYIFKTLFETLGFITDNFKIDKNYKPIK